MNKKRFIIIIVVILLLALGFFIAAYLISGKSGGTGGNGGEDKGGLFDNFYPFGRPADSPDGSKGGEDGKTGTIPGTGPGTGGDQNILGEAPFNPLVQLSTVPTSGAFIFERSGKTYVQYAERATGHVYEVSLDNFGQQRLSKTTVPGIHEALWTNAGKTILYRYLRDDQETIATFAMVAPSASTGTSTFPAPAEGEDGSAELMGVFLEDDILDVVISHDSKSAFYTKKERTTDKLFGYAGTLANGAAKKVFEHSFTEWLPVAFDGTRAWLQSKASQGVPGYLYVLNISSGAFTKVLGGVNGLTALPSPDGKKILYSESTRGALKTFLYNTDKKESKEFPVATLPEKCAWGKKSDVLYCAAPATILTATYPDHWYMGITLFTDNIWEIAVKDFAEDPLVSINMTGLGKNTDIVRPMLSADELRMIFINKKDSTLWLYRQR